MEELRGVKLLHAAVKQIIDHPETWDQTNWHCGTKHCIAGWCQILGGKGEYGDTSSIAQSMLALSDIDRSWLFSDKRTLGDIVGYANAMISGYDLYGYNRDGYNRDGYNRAGYNRAGYDRDGYNSAGYDRDGYNSAGYDRDGKKIELLPLP